VVNSLRQESLLRLWPTIRVFSLFSLSVFLFGVTNGSSLGKSLVGTISIVLAIFICFFFLRSFQIRFENTLTDFVISLMFCISVAFLSEFVEWKLIETWTILLVILTSALFRVLRPKQSTSYSVMIEESAKKPIWYLIFLPIFIVGFQVWIWYSNNLGFLSDSTGSQQIDISFHEALSNKIVSHPSDSISLLSGNGFSYHVLTHFIIGKINYVFGTEPFAAQVIAIPLLNCFLVTSLVYSLAGRSSKSPNIRYVPVILFLITPGFTMGNLWFIQSPSMALGVAFLLGVLNFKLYLLDNIQQGRSLLLGMVIYGLLCWLAVFAKSSNVFFVLMSMILFSSCLFFERKKQLGYKSFGLLAAQLAILFTFMALSARSAFASWRYATESRGEEIYGGLNFLRFNFGFLPEVFSVLSILVLPFFLFRWRTNHQFQILYSMPVATIGLSALLLDLDDGNEVYFLISSCSLILPLIPILFELSANKAFKTKLLVLIVGVSFLGSFSFDYVENSISTAARFTRAALPFVFFFLTLMVWLFTVTRRNRVRGVGDRGISRLVSIHLLFFSLSGLFSLTLSAKFGPLYSDSPPPIGFGAGKSSSYNELSSDYFNAGRWVRINTKESDLFATNHLCLNQQVQPSTCDSRWYGAEAITQRPFLIEGAGFGEWFSSDPSFWSLSNSLNQNPSTDVIDRLRELNIRYIWFNQKIPNKEILSFGTEVYRNTHVVIFRI